MACDYLVALNPDDAGVRYRRADAQVMARRYDEARPDYDWLSESSHLGPVLRDLLGDLGAIVEDTNALRAESGRLVAGHVRPGHEGWIA